MCGSPTSSNVVLGKRLNQSQGLRPRRKVGIAITIVKCSVCGLIYANPLPIPESVQDHYGVPPHEYWNDDQLAADGNYFSSQLKLFEFLYNGSASKERLRALDIGAGTGKCMAVLSKAGFQVYGVEASARFYEAAIARTEIVPANLKIAKLEDAEFEHDYFDFITFGAVLEHLYDPSAAISKAIRWLKLDGLMHAEVPSSSWLVSKLVNLLYRTTGSDYVTNLSPMHPPYHLYEFTLSSFNQHGSSHGYNVIHHQYHVCDTYMPKFADRIVRPLMRISDTGMQLEVWLKKTSSVAS
jgi:2-polyprenyl-3-methyl-5-hydroxy-6-metoxy-1,4-benzoquinol methylase